MRNVLHVQLLAAIISGTSACHELQGIRGQKNQGHLYLYNQHFWEHKESGGIGTSHKTVCIKVFDGW